MLACGGAENCSAKILLFSIAERAETHVDENSVRPRQVELCIILNSKKMKIIKEIEKGRLQEKDMIEITGGGAGECKVWTGSTQCVMTYNTCSDFEYLANGVSQHCTNKYHFKCDGYCN